MRVLFINNDGGGFADYVEVAEGMTVEKFFADKMPGRQQRGLSDPRQSSARGPRLRPARGRPRDHDPHEDRRGRPAPDDLRHRKGRLSGLVSRPQADALFLSQKPVPLSLHNRKEPIMALSNQEISEAAMRIRDRLKALSAVPLRRTRQQAGNAGRQHRAAAELRPKAADLHGPKVAGSRGRGLQGTGQQSSLAWPVTSASIEDAANRLDVPIPSLSELVAELRQAEKEFGQLSYDRKKQFVAVATEPIELEGVYLGEFEIRLLLARPMQSARPGGNVSDRGLRSPSGRKRRNGHASPRPGRTASAPAMRQRPSVCPDRRPDLRLLPVGQVRAGRIQPAVALCPAGQVGRHCLLRLRLHHRQRRILLLPSCENDFCEECMSYCRRCDDSYCQGCLTECTACEDSVCSGCLTRCPDCRRAICQTCLEENQCPCQQEKENHNGPDTTAAAASQQQPRQAEEPQVQTS